MRQLQHAGPRADSDRRLARQPAFSHEARKRARTVAALPDLTAIGIEDAIVEVDIRTRRCLDDENLVAADAETPVTEPCQQRRLRIKTTRSRIDHDKIIAGAMHLGEEIGSASCRERECQYVLFSVVAVSLKK